MIDDKALAAMLVKNGLLLFNMRGKKNPAIILARAIKEYKPDEEPADAGADIRPAPRIGDTGIPVVGERSRKGIRRRATGPRA